MGRSTTRAGPSQSQRPTQSQRPRGVRRQAHVDDDDDEDEQEENGNERDSEEMDADEDSGDSEVVRRANALVRLALFVEQRRNVLRREEINKKALGGSTRAFNTVFDIAQKKLRETFGMELVELPSRATLGQDGGNDDEGNEATVATGMKKKASAVGSKTYILRSTLEPILIEHAAQSDVEILEAEAGDQSILFPNQNLSDDEGEDSDEDAERLPKYYGSIISWTRTDQLNSVGILYVILSFVLVNGRLISDIDLRRHLKTLHLPSNPAIHPIRLSSSSTTRALNLDTYLTQLLKQGYLDRQQVGADVAKKAKKGGGVKRLRTQAEDQEEGRQYEWRWGPRAFSEVGEEYVAKFIAEFMVVSEADGEDDGRGRARQKELVKKMLVGIEKAAGGKLTEIK